MGELFFCGCLWNPDHIIYRLATELNKQKKKKKKKKKKKNTYVYF